ncbi:MAG: flagellar protein FlgN [Candidatus Caldatribacteriaceae bacterium]
MIQIEDVLNFLFALLEKELQLQKSLLECARQKKQYLLKNRMEELSELLEKEGELVFQAKETETKIRRIWVDVALQMGLESKNFSISYLASLAGEEKGKKFLALQEELKEILKEIHKVNQENAIIIRDTLDYIEVMFSIVLREFEKWEQQNYSPFRCNLSGGSYGILINGVI